MSSLQKVLDLSYGEGTAQGPAVPTRISRTFGGQILAQAVLAAAHGVEGKLVNSLHAYFIAPGDAHTSIRFDVEALRTGRSFAHRHVRASQGEKEIFHMLASFHRTDDAGPEHADAMPDVPGPEELDGAGRLNAESSRIVLEEWSDWDIRAVPDPTRDDKRAGTSGAGYRHVWFRNPSFDSPNPSEHRAGLAYLSDMTLLRSTLLKHQGMRAQLASLDHSIWFHRPVRIDEWLLFEHSSPSAHGGVAVAEGKLFNRAGQLVALVRQEGLVRELADGAHAHSGNGNW